jgi:hypothetical protein
MEKTRASNDEIGISTNPIVDVKGLYYEIVRDHVSINVKPITSLLREYDP